MHCTSSKDLPSALEHLEEIEADLTERRPALFLDYDGTLTPIVNRPEDALLSDEMRNLLKQLASLCTVAVVSGRDRADVERLVGLDGLIYAGSHGFDINGPGDMHMEYEGGKDCLPDLDEAEVELPLEIELGSGAQIERKRFAIAVHYRNAAKEDVPHIKKAVDEVAHRHAGLKKGPGKKVIELKPDIDWNKGRAVLWLLERLGLDKTNVLPIYIGDDLTDEDAFRALAGRGIGILVGRHGESTCATFKLKDVDELKQFLQRVTEMLKALQTGSE